MKKRVITGVIMALILVPVLLVPSLTKLTEVIIFLFVIVASIELLNMYDKEKKMHISLKIMTVILTVGLYSGMVASYQGSFNYLHDIGAISEGKDYVTLIYKVFERMHIAKVATPLNSLAISFIIIMATMVLNHDLSVPDVGKIFTCILYVGICAGAFTVLWFAGVRFIIYLLIVSTATDIFAYFFGMAFGKHKMAPYISPKKTWEGAIDGTVSAVILGFLFLFFYENIACLVDAIPHDNFFVGFFAFDTFSTPGKVVFILLLTLAISICSQIGDLIASKLKRNYGIKDYSNIFPGHGGILDRFDSAFFASAVFLVFIMIEQNLFPLLQSSGLI